MTSRTLLCLLGAAAVVLPATALAAPIELVGKGSIAGNLADYSGVTGTLTNADGLTIPHNQFGSFGGAVAYSGAGNRYIAVNDRGFGDGLVDYYDRMHAIDIFVDTATKTVTANLVTTQLLTGPLGQFTGAAAIFDRRLDPEAARVSRTGTLFISDEYGPFVYEFNGQGSLVRSLPVPAKYTIANPGTSTSAELPPHNTIGRQANRGMEGLAISPDGRYLFGAMQNALIQDGALDAANKRVGKNNRILRLDTQTGQTQEFVYQLDKASTGVNEIVAINDTQFLVLERDGNAGAKAAFKKIFKIDISGATDVSGYGNTAGDGLPTTGLPAGVIAASKELFIDLLDPAFGLAGDDFPEKVEALTWGPDLGDGRRLLLVLNDNDNLTSNPTHIWAFAVDGALLPGFQHQIIDVPFQVVPEPGSLVSLGALAGSLTVLARRRR